MYTTCNHIPKNWNPYNAKAISEWFEKLPDIKDSKKYLEFLTTSK